MATVKTHIMLFQSFFWEKKMYPSQTALLQGHMLENLQSDLALHCPQKVSESRLALKC